jgi:hypothetical protein
MSEFGTIQHVTQLELENFAAGIRNAEEGSGGEPLSAQDVRKRNEAARSALTEYLQDGDLPDWAEMYQRLLNSAWPWRVALYVAWASMPKHRRVPKTQDDLATEYLGLTSDRAISTWRKKYQVDQMIADLQADELLDARADVFHALKEMARTIDYKGAADRRVYLEMIGAYVPVTKLAAELRKRGISADDMEGMSVEELRELASAASERAGTRPASTGDVE